MWPYPWGVLNFGTRRYSPLAEKLQLENLSITIDMKIDLKLILLGVAIIMVLCLAWYNNKSRESFQNPTEPTFTMYYADWCGHCKNAKPEFEQLIAKSPMDVNGKKCVIRMVSPEKQPELAKGKPVKGFPTFLMEMPDGKVVEYKGARSTEGYLEFINKNLGGGVGDVSGDTESAT